ncbi:Rieske 2Fe-2S domain-containing protein [Desertibaculum subflavum]|uniref:Rieske 2Fe-2S domain-containing protein n=1 Tax=Desertibaculum subflavum TaxID=2268458 RepID=UPI0034D1AD1F
MLIGIRTHLRCVPLGQRLGDPHGDFGGWFCPYHGSHYNTSGRVRRGPAPKNVVLPAHRFIANASIKVDWAANHSNCWQADERPSKVRLVAIAG